MQKEIILYPVPACAVRLWRQATHVESNASHLVSKEFDHPRISDAWPRSIGVVDQPSVGPERVETHACRISFSKR